MTAPPIDRLFDHRDVAAVVEWLRDTGTVDIADAMSDLHSCDVALLFRLLPRERAIDVFEMLDSTDQQQVLDGLCDDRVRALLAGLDPADLARLPGEVPAKVANRFIRRLPTDESELTTIVLGYPEGSVGRHVTSEFVSLRRSMTAADARAKIRRHCDAVRDVGMLPVLDDQRHLVGVCEASEVADAAPTARLGDLMFADASVVTTATSEIEAARMMHDEHLDAVPVLDSEHRLVGLVTTADLSVSSPPPTPSVSVA